MDVADVKPFAKALAIVLGLVVFGLVARCTCGRSGGASDACNDLPIDRINRCVEAVRQRCSGTPEQARECAQAIARE